MVSFADYRLLLLLLMLHLNMELNLFQKPIVNILHVPDETHKVGTLRTVVRFNLQVSMFTFLWLQILHASLFCGHEIINIDDIHHRETKHKETKKQGKRDKTIYD